MKKCKLFSKWVFTIFFLLLLIPFKHVISTERWVFAHHNHIVANVGATSQYSRGLINNRGKEISIDNPRFHLMPSFKYGNIVAWGLSFGYYLANISNDLSNRFYFEVDYNYSNQNYSSAYFADPEINYQIVFNSLFGGFGYNFTIADSRSSIKFRKSIGAYNKTIIFSLTPQMKIGYEFVNGSEFMFDEGIEEMYSLAYRPGLRTGFKVNKTSYIIGIDYTLWNSMTNIPQGKVLVTDGIKEFLAWDKDLFEKRKGIQVYFGILFSF
jgi:hypothetical protein